MFPWGRDDPEFAIEPDGSARYLGPVRKVHPWRMLLYDIVAYEQALQYMGSDWPLGVAEHDITAFNRILQAARNECEKTFGSGHFHVLFYPLSRRVMQGLGVDWDRVKDVLAADGLDILDYRDTFAAGEDEMFYPGDEHPTARAHKAIADRLVKDLRLR